jgi:hypothetical protein
MVSGEIMSETAVQANGASLQDVIRLRVNRDKLKAVVTDLTAQRDEAVKRAEKSDKALEDYRAKAENSPLAKQNAELKQKLRDVEHRKTFDKLAAERGVTNGKAVDTLYEKSGWKADADEFDADQMGASIEATLEEHTYLKAAVTEQPANGQPVKPGPARGQGLTAKKTSLDPAIIEDDDPRMNDAAWQMKNQDKLVASAAAKTARGDLSPSDWTTAIQGIDGLSTR